MANTPRIADVNNNPGRIRHRMMPYDTYKDSTSQLLYPGQLVLLYKDGNAYIRAGKVADTSGTQMASALKLVPEDGTLVNSMIALGTITNDRLVDETITNAKIANGTIITDLLNDSAVTTAKIKDANVTAAKLATDSVLTAKIKDANVTTAKIADANVTEAKLASNAVTTVKIKDGNVTADKLATDSVTTIKIKNGNVTTDKIADVNVTTGKLADLAVTTGKIAANAVTAAKLGNIISSGAPDAANGITVGLSQTSSKGGLNLTLSCTSVTNATNATKLIASVGGSAYNVGGALKPIYFSNGIPVVSNGTKGGLQKPIYLDAGEIKESDLYAGGSRVNFNGSSYTSSFTAYAPTSAGTSDYVLKSNGSGAPGWTHQSNLTSGKIKVYTSGSESVTGGTAYRLQLATDTLGTVNNTIYLVY